MKEYTVETAEEGTIILEAPDLATAYEEADALGLTIISVTE